MLQAQPISALWTAGGPPAPYAAPPRWLTGLAALLLLSSPAWLYAFFQVTDLYDPALSYFLAPVILAVNAGLVWMCTTRDPFLRRTMLVALLAKVAMVALYLYMAFKVYNAVADVATYCNEGKLYAIDVGWGGHWYLLRPFWSTNAIFMLTGAMMVALGPALQAVNLIFASFAFWGIYFFYLAFGEVLPRANPQRVALLLFFFPSLLYWTAGVGKDSLILLFLGLTAYGFAGIARRVAPKCVASLTLGLAGVMLVRPHVAAMLAIAMLMPFTLSRNRRGVAGLLSKTILAPALLLGALYLSSHAQQFLQMESYSQASSRVQQVGESNYQGGSAFNGTASLSARALAAPVLFFRPFPWEAHNLQALLASAEGLLILWLAWKCHRPLLVLVLRWNSNAALGFLMLFLAEFSLVYSAAISNFGLLARQRAMAMPFLILLLCIAWSELPQPPEGPQPLARGRF